MRAIVKGDRDVAVISAASILAKTARDAMLVELDGRYPAYGFAHNRGYGTPEHLAALARHGPCPGASQELRAGRAMRRLRASDARRAARRRTRGCSQSCGRSRLTVSSEGR